MLSYYVSCVLWCPLRFRFEGDVRFVLAFSCLWEGSCLVCLFAYGGGWRVLCCVFVFLRLVCTLCCPILWIVNFVLLLRYSLTFIDICIAVGDPVIKR